MVWFAFEMVKVCVMLGAALKDPLPPWDAVIEQEPAFFMVTVAVPVAVLTVHTVVVELVKDTGKPDVAVADTLNCPSGENVRPAIVPKEIDWFDLGGTLHVVEPRVHVPVETVKVYVTPVDSLLYVVAPM